MANIFISYSSEDKTIVRKIAALLNKHGWSVWWDRNIPIGQHYDTVIETELKKSDCVLVIWTKRSVESEWVKNEASAAVQKEKYVPLILEELELPLAFHRTEAALMVDWDGSSDHAELELLIEAIKAKVGDKKDGDIGNNDDGKGGGIIGGGGTRPNKKIKWIALILASLLVLCVSIYFILSQRTDTNFTVRVFDTDKKALNQGDVTLYLNNHIRTQSIDKMGQSLFTGIPKSLFNQKIKIEIKSPGFTTKTFDTVLSKCRQLEINLLYQTTIFISGRIKTAAEMPIKNVEINVDGTRYVDKSKTDGSYKIRLDEYAIGDEISITTSHPQYEDKTISVRIQSPEIINQDIFLQPIQP